MNACHLNPYLGIMHRRADGYPSFVSDMIEEFRAPAVDSVVIDMINRGMVGAYDFTIIQSKRNACLMKDGLRKKFLEIFEKRMNTVIKVPGHEQGLNYREIIHRQLQRFINLLHGKAEQYEPYIEDESLLDADNSNGTNTTSALDKDQSVQTDNTPPRGAAAGTENGEPECSS